MKPTNSPPIELFLSRLPGFRKLDSGYIARCPAHADNVASLSLGEGEDGRVLIKCFAGCSAANIVGSLGLAMKDLFPEKEGILSPSSVMQTCNRMSQPFDQIEDSSISPDCKPQTLMHNPPKPPGVKLAEYAEAKQLPSDFLQRLGLQDMTYQGRPAIRIPYFDEEGSETAVRFRVALEKLPGEDNRFRWKKGSKLSLYGLWRIKAYDPQDSIVLAEGESDSQTLWFYKISALGIPGAGNWKENRDAGYLEKFSKIFVVIEPDAGGNAVLKWLASSKIRSRARLIRLGGYKDVSGLHLVDPSQFMIRWQKAIAESVPWEDLAKAELLSERERAWSSCKDLAQAPSILDRLGELLPNLGVVGEDRLAKIVYLALTSRIFSRPVSVAVKGPSSTGKSHVTMQVLTLFPGSAYYALSGMSERALAYSQEPLAHRFLVLYEAAGMSGEFATYLLRSLLSEGRIRYETVEKTKDGMKPKLIEREGPTGLIITTTAVQLHPENETRLLSIGATDTREQTQGILLAIAEGRPSWEVDLTPWLTLQEWLSTAESRVNIPYARSLALLIPPISVRLRRDFGTLITLISSHAFLHQATRKRDRDGQILATLEDYRVIRGLIADLIGEAAEATVSPTIRETVKILDSIIADGETETTVTDVANRLKIDKSAASRRIKVAIQRGYIKNLETRKRQPARLVLGDPLPEELEVLPIPDKLSDCTIAGEKEGIDTPPPSLMAKPEDLFNLYEGEIP